MTQKTPPLRSAGAAIAAVLALSSTTGYAQEMTAPVVAPAPPAAPVIVLPQAAPPAAPTPTIVVPVQPKAPAPKPEIAAAPAPAAASEPGAARTAARADPVAATPRRAVPVTAPAQTIAGPAAIDGLEAPVAAAPAAEVEFAPVQAPDAEVVPVDVTASEDGLSAGELGLIGGALAIGGLAAAAMFAGRRRRDPDGAPEDYVAATFAPRDSDADPIIAMPLARPRADAATVAPTATTATIAPFKPIYGATQAQTSKSGAVGRHMRMAEQGPTTDNPFLTRKNRMRRARFLDAQEAQAGGSTLSGNWLDDSNPRFRTAAAR